MSGTVGSVKSLQDLCCLRTGVFLAEFCTRDLTEPSSSAANLTHDEKAREMNSFVRGLSVHALERLTMCCSARVLEALHSTCEEQRFDVERAWAAHVNNRWGVTQERLRRPSNIESLG